MTTIKEEEFNNQLTQAIAWREKNQPEEALGVLKSLLGAYPNNPDIHYQIAWAFDCMGQESEAIPHYNMALANGLAEDRVGAMLGLGSSYRCVGEHEESLKTLDQAVQDFPDNRALKIFRALTLYSLGHAKESIREVLLQLLDTTSDSSIKGYEPALRFYADSLHEIEAQPKK